MAELPEPILRFVDRQIGHRTYEVASSEPTTGFGERPTGRYRRASIRVAEESVDPRIVELAREDAYFQTAPHVEVAWDSESRDVIRWTCDPAAREFGASALSAEAAAEEILRAVAVPSDRRVFRRAYPMRKFAAHLLLSEWGRSADGVEVTGDDAKGVVNVTTARVVSFSRGRWAPLPEFGAALPLDEARRIADPWAMKRGFDPALSWSPSRRIRWYERDLTYVRTWDFTYERETDEFEDSSPSPAPEGRLVECVYAPEAARAPRGRVQYASVSVDDAGRIAFATL